MDEMTTRDLFAMAALQGLLAGPSMVKASDLARYSYKIADEMIAESQKAPSAEPVPEEPMP
jgi:hypothetical protein